MTTFRQFLNEDPLDDLRLELALRQEFGFEKEQSKEIAAWLKGDLDSKDITDRDTWDALIELFIPQEEFVGQPLWKIEETVAEELQRLLKKKYKVFI